MKQRRRKRVSQQTADGFREFIYQGPNMLKLQMERDESETTVAQYTMGDGLEAMRRSGTSSFYHYNHLGTTLALTGANEAVTDTYQHDAWGVLLGSTGATVNPHTYVGQQRYYRMPTADLYHLGFRDYAQGLGRFTTVDPVLELLRTGRIYVANPHERGLPLIQGSEYHYAGARPTITGDPTGLFWHWVLAAVIIGGIVYYVWQKIWGPDDKDTPLQDLFTDSFGSLVDEAEACPGSCPTVGPLLTAVSAVAAINNREAVGSACKDAMRNICNAIKEIGGDIEVTITVECFDCCHAIVSNLPGYSVPPNFCYTACDNLARRKDKTTTL